MSSAFRSKAQTPLGDVKFVSIITPYYESPKYNNEPALLPFTITRMGQLDLLETSDYLAYYDNVSYPTPNEDNEGNVDIGAWIYIMGGKRVVESLGTNFKKFIAQWLEEKKDVQTNFASRVSLHTRGCVLSKVQQYFLSNVEGDNNATCAYISTVVPPSSDNFVQGGEEDNYGTSYLFKTPLVVKYVKEDGNTVYATLVTSIDED